MTKWGDGMTGNHRCEKDYPFSYQSLIPAAAGTPRYENCVRRSVPWCRPGFRQGTSPSATLTAVAGPGLLDRRIAGAAMVRGFPPARE